MGAAKAAIEMPARTRVLVVSSSETFRQRMMRRLAPESPTAGEATGGADALMRLEGEAFQTLILDRRLEDLDFNEVVQTIRSRHPHLHVIPVDSHADRDSGALEQYEQDSAAFIPPSPEHVSVRAQGFRNHQSELFPAPGCIDQVEESSDVQPSRIEPLPGMIGHSPKMRQLYRLARLVAPRDTAVLIIGGTGTGKELVARGIHQLSQRSRNPFVVVNCAAIPETLLEAELFGYTRGAFTGAFQSRVGRIHAAHGGTLVLDEIGELPLSMQAKLLRFVQEGEVQRLGSSDMFRVDVRLIAATNANLLERVNEKQFREDLYYRLNVFPLELPPLRERAQDILPLGENFLAMLCKQANVPPKRLSSATGRVLQQYSWPGNVRELIHLIERAFVLSENAVEITPDFLSIPAGPQ